MGSRRLLPHNAPCPIFAVARSRPSPPGCANGFLDSNMTRLFRHGLARGAHARFLRSCGLATAVAATSTIVATEGAAQVVPSKSARAVRLTGSAPRIDGVLDDAAWNAAPVISDFVQKVPVEGASPSVATEVRLLYDDHGLYVAARLKRPDPSAIRTSVTRRDGESDAEVFTVSLDPYMDRRTAYSFSISSGGVRGDSYHSQDSEDSGRETQYDPVWDARSRVDAEGWTAEMRIPFSQLRFNAAAEQTWGLEMTRNVADKSEELQWVLIPAAAAGYASHFGRLEGIAGIPPARRLELMPYVAGDLTYRANVNPRNPFDEKFGGRAGGDLKLGLGPNLTLDATVNPDFGQVEADPAVVNLTAFEVVFDERRPFFIEGNELLTGRGQSFIGRPTWFYSRRIGASPRGFASGDFVDAPTNTTIVSAARRISAARPAAVSRGGGDPHPARVTAAARATHAYVRGRGRGNSRMEGYGINPPAPARTVPTAELARPRGGGSRPAGRPRRHRSPRPTC